MEFRTCNTIKVSYLVKAISAVGSLTIIASEHWTAPLVSALELAEVWLAERYPASPTDIAKETFPLSGKKYLLISAETDDHDHFPIVMEVAP